MKTLTVLFLLAIIVAPGCNDPKTKPDTNNFNNLKVEICDNQVDDDGDGTIDCADLDCLGVDVCAGLNNVNNSNNHQPLFTLRGKVWGPGADMPSTAEVDKIPVPQALVAAYSTTPPTPEPLPTGLCTPCVEIPSGIVHQFSETDGRFELKLYPNVTYWLVIQKGTFRRVTQFTAGGPDEVEDLEPPAGQLRNSMTTLPARHNPTLGMWIPKILVIEGSYEQMDAMFQAFGFDYGVEVEEVRDTEARYIFADMNNLRRYNLIATTCGSGASYLTEPAIRANLRQYVREGGKLYVDDYSYDFAEQPFPEFLTFYDGGACGDGTQPPGMVGECNTGPSYNPRGTPGDPYLELWLNHINPGGVHDLHNAWDVIHSMQAGLQGECEDDSDPNCIDGNYFAPPKVWMNGTWSSYVNHPITVSWNFFCGKVLFTTYHTHAGSSTTLLLQEKIMMYLIMEIQTCSDPIIIG